MQIKKKRNKLQQIIHGMPFAVQYIILLFLGVLAPMVIQGTLYYWQVERKITSEMNQKLQQEMESTAGRISNTISDMITFAKSYDRNELLYHCLDYEYGGDLEFLVSYQEDFQMLFTDSRLLSGEIRRIIVYTDNMTMFNSAHIRKIGFEDTAQLGEKLDYLYLYPLRTDPDIHIRVAQADSRTALVGDSRTVSILCDMDYFRQYGRYQKLLRIDIDLNCFEEILGESSLFENMLLGNTDGRLISGVNRPQSNGTMPFTQQYLQQWSDQTVIECPVGEYPFVLYGVYDSGVFERQFHNSKALSLMVSIVCLVVSCGCVLSITRSISRRLRRLVRQSSEIAQGNFVTTPVQAEGKNEFDLLEKSMNQMSCQLQQLIEKEYKSQLVRIEQEKETNQAKLLALQAQVNPHFMFNALESIRLRALAKGERETAGVIKYMAKMFRNLIEWKDNIITLREEIGFLDEFLYIQNYRFEDEFCYEIDISEPAYDCRIPKMILQPLVENACIHGVEAVSENRWVKVQAAVDGKMLEIRVEDNGGGIAPERLEQLKGMLQGENTASHSVGIWNVYRRLILYYGENFSFDIQSLLGKGTVCILRLPAEKEVEQCFPS